MTQAEITAAINGLLVDSKPIVASDHRNADLLLIAELYAAIASIAGKQAALVSGTNIKTVNGNSIVGSGDVVLVEDAIVNGVTTKAPSQNKVFDELALKASIDYVDNAALGFISSWKLPVRLKTTGNVTLSGEQTIDGSLTSTDDVLVGSNTDQTENGIYTTAAGAWARRADVDTGIELEGAAVTVQEGATQANTNWIQQTDNITLGTSNIIWGPLGQNVADASPTVKGIAKLYNGTGSNTDGPMDQNSVTNALGGLNVGVIPFGETTGLNNYAVVMSPTVPAYVSGKLYHVRVTTTNTSSVTMAFDGLAAKKVYRTDGIQALTSHFLAGVDYLLSYNPTLDGGAGGFIVPNELQHGFMNTRGQYSGNAYPSAGGSGVGGAIRHGDMWVMSTQNTLSAGVVVQVGDMIFTAVDNPGQSASLWYVIPGRQSLALKTDLTTFVVGEVPSGTIDGVNAVFTLANTPIAGTLALYIAIRLKGGGVDYTLVGNQITFVIPPDIGANIFADYRK